MKVQIVGGGGREHALAWKIAQSPLVEEVIVAPGNAGIADVARCEPVSAEDVDGQIALAKKEGVELVIVGPEAPLVEGIADRLEAEGIKVFGPSAAASRLEGSKVFSKQFMERHNIPTARFTVHDDMASALSAVEARRGPCVVKADGLAAGKGVIICHNALEARHAVQDILQDRRFGIAGKKLIIEDMLEGEEASVLAICDGRRVVPLIAAQDHKAAFEGDTGPNTGGMGAYTPAPVVSAELEKQILEEVLLKTVRGMEADGSKFKGLLYAGLMIVDGKPLVLEFNVRFGDPECQPLLMMMKEDLVPVLLDAASGELKQTSFQWHDGAALCVVMAAGGYPADYEKGKVIKGLDVAAGHKNVFVFHAGTKRDGDNIVTSGGRVLGVTARGENHAAAASAAYDAANEISWDGVRMRRDIGHRVL